MSNDSLDIEMDYKVFAEVNMPVSAVCIFMNIFFIFSVISHWRGQGQLNQTLHVLHGSLIGSCIAIHVCDIVIVINDFYMESDPLLYIVFFCATDFILYTMMIIASSSHWLNVFYYFQIVPAQRSCFIWLKKNLRVFIYSALILTAIFYIFVFIVDVIITTTSLQYYFSNQTFEITNFEKLYEVVYYSYFTVPGLISLSVCIMLASSCSTAYYLWKHMKKMEDTNSSSPRFQRQLKVTIVSIAVQAFLHFIFSAAIITDFLNVFVFNWYFDMYGYMWCTLISFYSLGTTINIGFSRSLFRNQVVKIWRKISCRSSISQTTIAHTISSNILST